MTTLGTNRIKRCILYGQLIILLFAFTSIYPQIHGLFGERGLLPVSPMLECEEESVFQCRLPLLRFICNLFHFSPSVGLQLFSLTGVCLAALAIHKPECQNLVTFLTLYFLYRTIYEAGGVFMYYQWDAFLLESTVYVAVLAWFDDGPADSVALFSIVALLVRVIFMNGASKLLSKCPAWWNLTALDYHFESQPLPTPFSWYAHHFPPFFKQLATIAIYYFEIILPPLFLIPVIHVRYVVFFCQILLMILTMLTGNNGFFNYNVIILLVSLLETPRVPVGAPLLSALVFGKLGYDLAHRMPVKLVTTEGSLPSFVLNLSYDTFQKLAIYYIDMIIILTALMFSIINAYTVLKGLGSQARVSKIVHVAFVAACVLLLNIYGSVPLLRMDEKLAQRTNENPMIMSYYKIANSWSVANPYGTYRHMTGQHGRPEIVIEGAPNFDGPWKEIEFKAKPGSISRRPDFVSPHHPRLDAQMYYAAEGTYQQNPFFLSLVYHLMQNTTEVVSLIENYPFKNRSEPMQFVRAKLYMYHFTDIGDKNWWRRDFQEEYMPPFNKGNQALMKFLVENKIINNKKSQFVNGPLGKGMKQWHRLTGGADLIAFFTSIIVLLVIRYLHNRLHGNIEENNGHNHAHHHGHNH
ncbi:hypothetical protein CRE_00139 [Caenorhabditis remanei]|uniref:Lipase maturation factor n=1 Tax=Caenorhabditis remanei TaxID=31234 RepID=E3LDC7_CAERE|nr:hypothetical protein CRE_00139 [Caenorhabditis remanei]